MANPITTKAAEPAAFGGISAKCCSVPKFIPDEFQKIKVITIKLQGINHALPVTSVYLVIYTNHFLRALRRVQYPEFNVSKSRVTSERRTVSQLGWVQTALGRAVLSSAPRAGLQAGKPRRQRQLSLAGGRV